MGLKLPTGKTRDKALYTGVEIGLLFLTFLLDNRTGFFPLLGLIIVIRSCLYFQQVRRKFARSYSGCHVRQCFPAFVVSLTNVLACIFLAVSMVVLQKVIKNLKLQMPMAQ